MTSAMPVECIELFIVKLDLLSENNALTLRCQAISHSINITMCENLY